MFTAGDLAMSRDESFYVVAAEDYGRWYAQVFDDPEQAFTRESIDRHWAFNNEHPGTGQDGVCVDVAARSAGLAGAARVGGARARARCSRSRPCAYRFGGMLSAALMLWLIYIFGTRAADRRLGLFAALAFAPLPRVFYHAHLDCFDVPIMLMITVGDLRVLALAARSRAGRS